MDRVSRSKSIVSSIWECTQSSLDLSKYWSLPERWRVGIGADQNGVTFHTVRLLPVNEGAAPAAEAKSSK